MNIENIVVIYKYNCKINKKLYVGQTKDFERRQKQHIWEACKEAGSVIDRAIAKHGIENFDIEIIECVEASFADEAEAFWIQDLNTLIPNGYNVRPGGHTQRGWLHSEETKQKQREIMTEKYSNGKHPRKGVPNSAEHNKSISDALKGISKPYISGENHYSFGLASEDHPSFGRVVSEETRQKQRESMQGKYDGENSIRAKLTNLQAEAIRNDTRSSRKIAKDYGVDHKRILAIKNGKSYKKSS